jgi:rubredoxin
LTFAEEAEIPALWECPRCGAESLRTDGTRPEAKDEKPPRTHWDMLRERRSIPELEELLAERLDLLRSGELGPNYAATSGGKSKKTA